MQKINGLTGLRGLAALWVMLFHMTGVIVPMLGTDRPLFKLGMALHFNISPIFEGQFGVNIFFVLTGFLLFIPFAEQLINPEKEVCLKYYCKRRLLRILPAYYAQIAVLSLLSLLTLYDKIPLDNWLAHIGIIHNFSSAWNGEINGVWWTLPVEMHFYVVLPFLFLFIRRFGWGWFWIVIMTIVIGYKAVAFHFIAAETPQYKLWILGQLPGRLDLFSFGMFGAWIHKSRPKGGNEWVLPFCLVYAWILLQMISDMGNRYWDNIAPLVLWDFVFGGCIMAIIVGISQNMPLSSLFSNRITAFLGTISYSLYLWHVPMLKIILLNPTTTRYISGNLHYWHLLFVVIGYIVATFGVASASYFFVERPFMRMR